MSFQGESHSGLWGHESQQQWNRTFCKQDKKLWKRLSLVSISNKQASRGKDEAWSQYRGRGQAYRAHWRQLVSHICSGEGSRVCHGGWMEMTREATHTNDHKWTLPLWWDLMAVVCTRWEAEGFRRSGSEQGSITYSDDSVRELGNCTLCMASGFMEWKGT